MSMVANAQPNAPSEPASTRDERIAGPSTFWRRFRSRPSAVVGLVFLIVVTVIAVGAPLLAPADPNAQNLGQTLQGPSSSHWLGTDELGRDVLSRLMFGARVSLLAAVEAVSVGLFLGAPVGLAAGYFRGWVDATSSRIAEAVLSFPPLLLAIAIVGVLGPSLTNAMLAIGVVFSPRFFRLVRGAVLSVREEAFIEAARTVGSSNLRILRQHVSPSVASPLLIQVMLATGLAMLSEAALSFLGLGVQPPDASWGAMLGSAYRHVSRAPWQAVYPGLAIVLVVLAANMVGEGLRLGFRRRMERSS
jgi:peptide/nickel transport system permease protein